MGKEAKKHIKRVLAVDDEEVMGYVIQRIVQHLGYEVDWVPSYERALEKIEKEEYDIILSDFRMPTMTGERFYREIVHRNHRWAKKLVFITGDLTPQTLAFLDEIHVPVISKPFNIDELQQVLEQIIS